MTHFVSASCEGNLCSVCKAPATHKLGEEVPHDEPRPPCPECRLNWLDLAATVCEHPWRRPCTHCGYAHPYTDDDDDRETCPTCEGELYPVSVRNCRNLHHTIIGFPRHNLTAYVCCSHFTMILGSATECSRCPAWRIPDHRTTWTHSYPGTAPAAALQCVLPAGHAGEHAHPSFTIGPITIMTESQSVLFKDAIKVRDRAMEIHRHGASHSSLAMVVFDLAELVAAIARGDK